MRLQNCDDPSVTRQPLTLGQGPPDTEQVEHTVPLVAVANYGRQWAPRPAWYRRSDRNGGWIAVGQIARGPAHANFWQKVWNDTSGLPASQLPVTPTPPELTRLVDRIYEAAGSNNNPSYFTTLQASINGVKGVVEVFKSPMDPATLRSHVSDALDHNASDPASSINSFLEPLRELRGLFQYLNSPDVVTRLDATSSAILS